MPIHFPSRGRFCAALLSALLGVSSVNAAVAGSKTSEDPSAVYKAILQQRHVLPQEALKRAKKAYADSRVKLPSSEWEPRFRLLYADILIEQSRPLRGNVLSEVAALLAFTPPNPQISARLFAVRAYMERKKTAQDDRAAKEMNQRALALEKANPLHDSCWRVEVLLHYAQTLISLDDGKALDSLAEAEPEAQNCVDPYWKAILYITYGSFYSSRFRFQEELVALEQAKNLAEAQNYASLIPLARSNLALAYVDIGDFDKALAILERTVGASEVDKASILSIKAFIHNLRGENPAARNDYLGAVEILKPLKPSAYYEDLEELSAVLIEMDRLDEADRYNQEVIQHANANGPPGWMAKEAKCNAASIARLRGNLSSAYDQLTKLQISLTREVDTQVIWRLHSELAQTLAAMGRNEKAESEFEKAVAAASQARGKITSDQARMTFSIYVERLVTRYIEFLVRLKAPPETSLKLAETFRAQRLAEKLHSPKTPPPERFRAIARSRQAVILSYWITNQGSYLWATTAGGTKVFALSGLENLGRDIDDHNIVIYRDEGDLLQTPESSTDLYRRLVAPAESLISRGSNVIIVPSGPLAALNFETLIPPGKPAKYWLHSVSVTVAPSLSILGDESGFKGRSKSFLLLGGALAKGLASLPGSVSELQDIVKRFPEASIVQLTGTDATPQRFLKSKPGDFSLLHISAHAFANKESPLDSYIVLTPDGTHPEGHLYAHDLMKLSLNEELVTLSACEGAGGKSLPGEGQVGLTWAILSAGAGKVVASSSKVSDRATAIFMKDFYTRLTAGEKPANALHDAKVALASKDTVPYFWAAFQLYTR